MSYISRRFSIVIVIAGLISMVACGGGSGGSEQVDQKSFLILNVTDAPVDDATEVVVEFTGVEIKPAAGDAISFDFNQPRQIDLLALQGDNSEPLLNGVEVDSGQYNWIRLKVNAQRNTLDSYITLNDGSTFSLFVPSGDQRGLQLNGGFLVPLGQSVSFTIDFDLRKSVINPPGQSNDYFLKPTLKLIDNTQISTIRGTVDASVINDAACNEGVAVYLFQGLDFTPDDEGSANSPFTSSLVSLDNGTYRFVVGFLPPGDYTLALTCDADLDDPESDDDITFIATQNISTLANQAYQVAFE
ncbi:DUF4382 domain-containing protein [Aliikangiella marina]|uniref:DUF4382 domain-containing protein n=1 Tax=Aliikangiella marina TaxID=1712262 RepID=A0A545TJA1_9GAMM|nr:DUF4382 domain-containing protein [Aliikangiella marina]TQV77309.1 DUF4382 domain-containing protein [Aliikangiella marina]